MPIRKWIIKSAKFFTRLLNQLQTGACVSFSSQIVRILEQTQQASSILLTSFPSDCMSVFLSVNALTPLLCRGTCWVKTRAYLPIWTLFPWEERSNCHHLHSAVNRFATTLWFLSTFCPVSEVMCGECKPFVQSVDSSRKRWIFSEHWEKIRTTCEVM